jgi:3-oxoacyl-[acyl-carrier protein] reductase
LASSLLSKRETQRDEKLRDEQGWSRWTGQRPGPRGITINNIQPGPTDTDMKPTKGDFADMLRRFMAVPHYGSTDDIAAMVAYLAGPEAAFVTGASLTIDGGFNA